LSETAESLACRTVWMPAFRVGRGCTIRIPGQDHDLDSRVRIDQNAGGDMRRLHRATTTLALAGMLVLLLAVPGEASAYTSRRAARAERTAILRDAKRTQPCGYAGGGSLGSVRVVSYRARREAFTWAAVLWTPSGPDAQGCVLIFLHAAGFEFHSVEHPSTLPSTGSRSLGDRRRSTTRLT
jgi:hypothetical protein